MKRAFMFFCALSMSAFAQAQSSVGLIAHWPMTGSAADTSGNGHNGHMVNVAPAPGMDGIAGHALSFNGANSMVTVPYSPAFNLPTSYSICAIINAQGFYAGNYANNIILTRGKTGPGSGTYYLTFSSYPHTLDCCTTDTTRECFEVVSETRPVSTSGYDYTPNIVPDQWYKVIGTFNDTVFQVYVNGVLKSTVGVSSPGMPLGTSTDSICIGYDIFEATAGYPFQFKGYIDDIMLFNRVLNDSEIVHYGDTCGRISLQPVNDTIAAGGTANYSIGSSIVGALYQWQEDAGAGFINLSNTAPYSGVYTPSLTITGAASGMSSNHYRCLVSNTWGCADTSASSLLSVSTTGVAPVAAADNIEVYPNPTTGKCFINLPVGSNATIELIGITGQLLLKQTTDRQTETIDMTGLASGVYILRIECNGNITYRKLAKH